MSKLSIRPRNLDACKFIPIYKCEEIPDLNDYASINRSIPQLPTGMEKEEESEHHLQQAISAQQTKGTTGELVIPTPEVYDAPENFYNELYPLNYKLSRQYIHVQPFAIEHDIPDYDMDSEDELWLEQQKDYIGLTPLKFEEIMDRLEKSSSQHVITLKEAKILLKEDEDLIIAVFDYWLNKRLRTQTPLIPQVRTERRDLAPINSNNPYIAFRRRTEKMQTRKNRKNDEISYEKMLKLRRDLSRAMSLLNLVKQREKTKLNQVKLAVDIFEKRYTMGDFSGSIINELTAQRQARQQQNMAASSVLKANENKPPRSKDESGTSKKKREYKKRIRAEQRAAEPGSIEPGNEFCFSSDDDDTLGTSQPQSDQDEDDSDGPFSFKRKKGCQYYAPISDELGNWPFYSAEEQAHHNDKYRYYLTEIKRENPRYLTFARKRIGRGGRIIFDRLCSPLESKSTDLDTTASHEENTNPRLSEIERLISERHYFRSKAPNSDLTNEDCVSDCDEPRSRTVVDEFGNPVPVIPINLNDYLNNDDFDKSVRHFTSGGDSGGLRLVNFETHQEELVEMHKQMQMLQHNQRSSSFARLSLEDPTPSSPNHQPHSHPDFENDNEQHYNNNHQRQRTQSSSLQTPQNHNSVDGNRPAEFSDPSDCVIKQESSQTISRGTASSSTSASSSFGVIGSISASGALSNSYSKSLSQSSHSIILPQSSTLDPESVQFAVSALLSSNPPSTGPNVLPGPAIAATALTNTTPRQPGSSSSSSLLDNLNNVPVLRRPSFDEWSQSKPEMDPKCKVKFSGSQNNHSAAAVVLESGIASTDVT